MTEFTGLAARGWAAGEGEAEAYVLEALPRAGLSADYVERETRRGVAAVSGAVRIWAGIDIDIPTSRDEKTTEPGDVHEAVLAAVRAGADGVVLSRKYSEMRLANLRAAGEGLARRIRKPPDFNPQKPGPLLKTQMNYADGIG